MNTEFQVLLTCVIFEETIFSKIYMYTDHDFNW